MGHRLQNTTQKMTFISLGLLQNMVNQQHELTRKVCYFNFAWLLLFLFLSLSRSWLSLDLCNRISSVRVCGCGSVYMHMKNNDIHCIFKRTFFYRIRNHTPWLVLTGKPSIFLFLNFNSNSIRCAVILVRVNQ